MSRKKEKNEPFVYAWAKTCYGIVKDYDEWRNKLEKYLKIENGVCVGIDWEMINASDKPIEQIVDEIMETDYKDCLDCKHSYCEDLYGELCCKQRHGKLCPHELIGGETIYLSCSLFEDKYEKKDTSKTKR